MFGIINYRLPHHTKCFPCCDFNNKKKPDISEAEDLFYVGITRAKKDIIFLYSMQDEQNLSRTTRKISCLFAPLFDYLILIDTKDNKYSYKDGSVINKLCIK